MASGSFTSVNLSQLPAPAVIEVLDFEAMFDESLTALQALDPTFDALLPSDPAFKILEVCTYLRLLDRQRVNDAARGVMLAYAGGSDLDHLAAIFGVARQVLDPGRPQEGIPPRYESDEDFRRRIQLGPEGFSVAGPEGAYVFHALSADPRVLDASATSPAPGEVVVSVLSREADGTATQGLLDIVEAKLSADDVRPLTDHVLVKPATIVTYSVDATLFTFAGPDSQVVLAEARTPPGPLHQRVTSPRPRCHPFGVVRRIACRGRAARGDRPSGCRCGGEPNPGHPLRRRDPDPRRHR